MSAEKKPIYKLVADAEGHVFVNANTKFVKDLNQADMEVLFNNGDPRIQVEPVEEKKTARVVAATQTV